MIVQAISIRREGYSFGYSSYRDADASKPFHATVEIHGRSGKTELQLSPEMSKRILDVIADEVVASSRATADAMTADILEATALPAPIPA